MQIMPTSGYPVPRGVIWCSAYFYFLLELQNNFLFLRSVVYNVIGGEKLIVGPLPARECRAGCQNLKKIKQEK